LSIRHATGREKSGKRAETRYDREIAKFLAPRNPDVWHRLEKFEQARAERLAADFT
jgi:hypothetical protein